jgi:hypothetical protein
MIFSAHDFPSLNGATFLSQAAQVDSLDSLMQERAVLSLVSPCFTMFHPRYHVSRVEVHGVSGNLYGKVLSSSPFGCSYVGGSQHQLFGDETMRPL